jgi:hypothetical protein
MHRQVAQLRVLRETEQQPERADEQPPQQQRPASDAARERGLIEIWQHQGRFTAGRVLSGGRRGAGSVLKERKQRRQTRHAQRSPGVVQNWWSAGATTIMAGRS